MLSELFPVIFQRISSKLGLYIGSTSCINPVNFQVRTQKVKVTVRKKNQKMGGGGSVLESANGTIYFK